MENVGTQKSKPIGNNEFNHEDLNSFIMAASREILREPALSDDREFFESGGDAVTAVLLIERIRKFSGLNVPARMFYEYSIFK